MNKLTKQSKALIPPNGIFAKAVTVLFMLGLLYALSSLIQAYSYTLGGQPQAYLDLHNAGRTLSIALLILLGILTFIHRDFYFWFNKSKSVKLDERQISVQRRIMERSYNVTLVILLIFMYQVVSNKTAIINSLQNSPSNDWAWIPFNVLMLIAALPLFMATWREDLYLTNPKAKNMLQKINFKRVYLTIVGALISLLILSWISIELANQFNIQLPAFALTSGFGLGTVIVIALTVIPIIFLVQLMSWLLGNK